VADEGEFTSISFATSSTLFMSADFRPKDVARGFTRDPLTPDRGLNSISPSRYVIDWGVCPTVLLTEISDPGTLPYALTCRCNTLAGSRPIVDFIRALNVKNTTKFRFNSLPLSNSTIHLASTYFNYGKARKEEEACPRNATCVPRGGGVVLGHAHLYPHRVTPRENTPSTLAPITRVRGS